MHECASLKSWFPLSCSPFYQTTHLGRIQHIACVFDRLYHLYLCKQTPAIATIMELSNEHISQNICLVVTRYGYVNHICDLHHLMNKNTAHVHSALWFISQPHPPPIAVSNSTTTAAIHSPKLVIAPGETDCRHPKWVVIIHSSQPTCQHQRLLCDTIARLIWKRNLQKQRLLPKTNLKNQLVYGVSYKSMRKSLLTGADMTPRQLHQQSPPLHEPNLRNAGTLQAAPGQSVSSRQFTLSECLYDLWTEGSSESSPFQRLPGVS